MTDSLENPLWHRVAALKPRLRLRVRVQRRVGRGAVWYVLIDDEQRRFHRLDAAAYQFVGRLDGRITVDDAWRSVHAKLGDQAPTQSEALRLLAQLNDAELLMTHAFADVAAVLKRRGERQRGRRAASANPLSFKVPLFDPTRLLKGAAPLARWLFSGNGLMAWLALMAVGAALAMGHASQLQEALALNARSASFLVQMWFILAPVKLLHEACHALAVLRFGGEVREVGMHLVMLNPLPYVDASASNGFVERHRRMVVSAVGVMAELAIAACALAVWHLASSPSVQTVALEVIAVCGLSTLVFNANPLARFDGYYVLCDALDLPNLQQRGRAMVVHLVKRCIGACHAHESPEPSRREAWLVAGYAVLSWLYQCVVIASVVYWLSRPYVAIGLGIAAFGAWFLLVRPLWSAVGFLVLDSRLNGRRARAWALSASAAAAAGMVLFVVPAPSSTVQQAVVWAPPDAIVRAEAPGELVELLVHAQERVHAGQVIARFDNLQLRGEREAAAVKCLQLDTQYFNAMLSEPLEARRLDLERDAVGTQLERLDAQLADLTVRAKASGRWLMPKDTGQPGHFYPRGKDIGYVLPEAHGLSLKVALTEEQASLVRAGGGRVSVRLLANPEDELTGTLGLDGAGVTRVLPSAILGSAAGGPIDTDPNDPSGRRALRPVAVLDVQVPGRRIGMIGARAWVRFEHPGEPLAAQWTRRARQAFLALLGAQA